MSRSPRAAVAAAAAAAALVALPAAAHGAPAPFGHACTPQDGVRFCPTTGLDQRVASFDGTPLDVDVTLPATGDGPFPTIILHHGLGGTKLDLQRTSSTNPGYDNVSFARAGYAVVTPTARGFGDSCGRPESRTDDCRNGFVRLADVRYEVRDLQTLLGRLVDDGVADPARLGSTGISYGGGMSTMLAFLKDRVRLPDGRYAPWTSPAGVPMRLTAAWPRWHWTNGESIFLRNGREDMWSRNPTGVVTQAYAGGIFFVANRGWVVPTGGPLSTDINLWKAQLDRGTFGPDVLDTLDLAYGFHGAAGLKRPEGGPAPLLMQSGWTDALFPAGHSISAYARILARDPRAPVAMQLSDLGHAPGGQHVEDNTLFNQQGLRFFDSWLKGTAPKLRSGQVTAFATTCPGTSPQVLGPFSARHYDSLATETIVFGTRQRLRITSRGASAALAEALSPLGPTASHCTERSPDGTSRATFAARVKRSFTMLGRPIIAGRIAVRGRNGQLAARLWDVDRQTGKQRLITRGVLRLTDNQRGRFRFALDGNGWRLERGHLVSVELLGRDAPTYQASPTPFSATMSGVKIGLPAR